MKVTLERIGDDFYMEAKGKAGVPFAMDHSGMDEVRGSSPMEVLLGSLIGCSAIDIISILKKQRLQIDDFRAEITGERHEVEQAKPFKSMSVKFYLKGDIPLARAKRAAALSFEKYCSVSMTLANVALDWEIYVNDELA